MLGLTLTGYGPRRSFSRRGLAPPQAPHQQMLPRHAELWPTHLPVLQAPPRNALMDICKLPSTHPEEMTRSLMLGAMRRVRCLGSRRAGMSPSMGQLNCWRM